MYTFAAKQGCLLASSPFDSIISAVFFSLFFLFAAPTHCELLRKLQVSSQSVPRPRLPVVWREVVGKEERKEVWRWRLWWEGGGGGGSMVLFFLFFQQQRRLLCCLWRLFFFCVSGDNLFSAEAIHPGVEHRRPSRRKIMRRQQHRGELSPCGWLPSAPPPPPPAAAAAAPSPLPHSLPLSVHLNR